MPQPDRFIMQAGRDGESYNREIMSGLTFSGRFIIPKRI